jgi:hypothetical protein
MEVSLFFIISPRSAKSEEEAEKDNLNTVKMFSLIQSIAKEHGL